MILNWFDAFELHLGWRHRMRWCLVLPLNSDFIGLNALMRPPEAIPDELMMNCHWIHQQQTQQKQQLINQLSWNHFRQLFVIGRLISIEVHRCIVLLSWDYFWMRNSIVLNCCNILKVFKLATESQVRKWINPKMGIKLHFRIGLSQLPPSTRHRAHSNINRSINLLNGENVEQIGLNSINWILWVEHCLRSSTSLRHCLVAQCMPFQNQGHRKFWLSENAACSRSRLINPFENDSVVIRISVFAIRLKCIESELSLRRGAFHQMNIDDADRIGHKSSRNHFTFEIGIRIGRELRRVWRKRRQWRRWRRRRYRW